MSTQDPPQNTDFPGLFDPWPSEIYDLLTQDDVDLVNQQVGGAAGSSSRPAAPPQRATGSWSTSSSMSTGSVTDDVPESTSADQVFTHLSDITGVGMVEKAPTQMARAPEPRQLPLPPLFVTTPTKAESTRQHAPRDSAESPASDYFSDSSNSDQQPMPQPSSDPFANYREAMQASITALASENNKTLLDSQWSPELLQMDVKQLNRWLKQAKLPERAIQELKEARRRRKNRVYAKKSRQKRMADEEEVPEPDTKAALKKSLCAVKDELEQLQQRQSRYEAFFRQLHNAGKLDASDIAMLRAAEFSN